MAWYWGQWGDGEEEYQAILNPVTTTNQQHAETMDMDLNVSAGRSPAEGAPKFMRFLCKVEAGSSNMPIELSPSSKRSIHNLFCLDTPTAVESTPNDSTCVGTAEHDPEALCEPPAGAEEIFHDDNEGWAPKRQRVFPF